MDASFAAGVALACFCSVLNSSGMGLQKLAHRRLGALPEAARPPVVRDRGWALGLVCMAFASIASLGNYALLGQSRASAMASLTIVSNAVMARFALHETLTAVDAASSVLIGAGIVVAVVYGSSGGGAPRTSLDEVLALLRRDTVYAASGAIVAVLLLAEAFVRFAERRGAARTFAEGKLECFARAFLAGLFSGCTGFLAKSVIVSVESMVVAHSTADLARFEIWLLGLSLPVSIVMQLRHLNGGLRRFNAMDVVPMYQACIVVVGVAWGWIFYEEDSYLAPTDKTMFAVGVGISVLGIVLLSLKSAAAGDAAAATAAAAAATAAAAAEKAESAPLLKSADAAAVNDAAADERAAAAAAAAASALLLVAGSGRASSGSSAASSRRGSSEIGGGGGGGGGGSGRNSARDRTDSVMNVPGQGFVDAIEGLAPKPIARFISGAGAPAAEGARVAS